VRLQAKRRTDASDPHAKSLRTNTDVVKGFF
jgi:hypothetical protein